MKRLYLAYGSNLNIEQMKRRCPTATIYGKGAVRGYRLLFKGTEGNAYLTIEPCQGEAVPVVVWDIKPDDELALDRYEGYPRLYEKEDMIIELETGEVVETMVYIMTDKVEGRTSLNMPSERYLITVAEGYKSAGFDVEVIQKALKASRYTQ